MGKYVDITGHKYGRLTALLDVGKDIRNGRVWKCICECGNYVDVPSTKLRRNHTRSCGCLKLELSASRFTTHGHSKKNIHSAEYTVWSGMKSRCYNENHEHFDKYGGRGITVCERWMDFEKFFEDMGKRPSRQHTIDRIDTNGNYEPGNCRWATKTEQARNQRMKRNNKSGIRGVHWRKQSNKWTATIGVDGRHVVLGYFGTVEEAIEARRQGEIKYWNKKPS